MKVQISVRQFQLSLSRLGNKVRYNHHNHSFVPGSGAVPGKVANMGDKKSMQKFILFYILG
jgi:hypothetical protein